MKYKKLNVNYYLVCCFLLLSITTETNATALDKKGKFYFYYGWNRASYSNSDYRLKGDGYDFTLRDVKATDTQSELGLDPYLHPTNWSIPQTNVRLGYYLSDTLSISFGNDHMKYVMIKNQTVQFEGKINTEGPFDREGEGQQQLTTNFLIFEHTDGLNFISTEIEKYHPLWSSKNGENALSFLWGPGLAIMIPKTNSTLFNQSRNDEFNVAGYGYSIKAGMEFILYDKYFTRLVAKYGIIRMDNVRTTSSTSDKLSQEFEFSEAYLVFGGMF